MGEAFGPFKIQTCFLHRRKFRGESFLTVQQEVPAQCNIQAYRTRDMCREWSAFFKFKALGKSLHTSAQLPWNQNMIPTRSFACHMIQIPHIICPEDIIYKIKNPIEQTAD